MRARVRLGAALALVSHCRVNASARTQLASGLCIIAEQPVYIEPEVIGPIREARTIAVGRTIRELERLIRTFGSGRWRKRKGIATVRLPDCRVVVAEVHWHEARGVGRLEFKVKRILRGNS